MRTIIVLTVLATSFLTTAQAAINNQIDVGFSDLSGSDNRFVGARYRYFTSNLDQLSGPHSIKSHLNQVTNFAVGGFASDDVEYVNADATYYGPLGLILMGGVERLTDNQGYWRSRDYLIKGSLGKQINEELQLGFSVFYNREEDRSHLLNTYTNTDTQWRYAPYVRYTAITDNQGWDLELKQISGKNRNIEGRANYFVNQDWSVGLIANVQNSDYARDNYELQTQYWFAPHVAVKFGLGSSFDSDSGLNSASLLLTGRF
ncbi:putative porin [Pseudoalteromonas sp. Z9A5]|uniref:putative porin n=1 Tax=Pseudoalteromonas sp. Z9A5 TaxID=2686355 RepID=UPI001407A575|nr:putative porin [Pseudoalteromonas sp. Z9A5]